jgi:hypothetical protein
VRGQDGTAVRSEHLEPVADDDPLEVLDAVRRREQQRHVGQAGQLPGGEVLLRERRLHLLRAGEQVRLDLLHPAAPLAPALPVGLHALPLADEVGDVLGALHDEPGAAVVAEHRHADQRPEPLDEPAVGGVRDVVALDRHRVGSPGVTCPLEGSLHAGRAGLVQRVGAGRERLEHGPADDLLPGTSHVGQVRVVRLDQHEVGRHDHVGRRQRPEQPSVVDVPQRRHRVRSGTGSNDARYIDRPCATAVRSMSSRQVTS